MVIQKICLKRLLISSHGISNRKLDVKLNDAPQDAEVFLPYHESATEVIINDYDNEVEIG